MKIVGLNHDMYISSAAMLDDGALVAMAAEERFTRQKQTRAFPHNALRYCLNEASTDAKDIDAYAIAWNPGAYWRKFNPLMSSQRRSKSEYMNAVMDNIFRHIPTEQGASLLQQTAHLEDNRTIETHFVMHHQAHAANAFFLSPFENAAIMTADAQGEFQSTTLSVGTGRDIKFLEDLNHPHSLGSYYATFTEYLGFRAHSDEWKVMALAAYADPDPKTLRLLREEIAPILEDGLFRLGLNYFQDFLFEHPNLFSPAFVDLLGPPRNPDEPLSERHYSIAAAMQLHSEDIATHCLTRLHSLTGADNLCVSGGFFMNSVFNGKILHRTPFKSLFISSCPDDSGNSAGAALWVANMIKGQSARPRLEHNYLGPSYSNSEIEDTLARYKLQARHSNSVEVDTAKLLAEGKLVGWFQGRMEFGQRALGNRSILADPRSANTKATVNAAVKYREGFRPFAPAILADKAPEYFHMDSDKSVPFMERVFMVREEKRSSLGAVVHEDGSGRLQTVSHKHNARFYSLIKEFGDLTGVPVVLNTSFNLNGEPVVMTPTDAIRTFHSCGLDVLVLGDFILTKE